MRIIDIPRKNKIVFASSLIIFAGLYFYFENLNKQHLAVQSFKDCVAAGYPLLKTYPERCKIPGKIFENPLQAAEPLKTVTEVATSTPYLSQYTYKNIAYTIEGSLFRMSNGVAFMPPNATTRATTTITYFGKEVRTDFNNDKEIDIAFLVTSVENTVSSNFYIVTALQKEKQYTGTNAILIGKDIIPLSTHYENKTIVVRFTTKFTPNKPQARYFTVENNLLKEITQ
jgi:hypothetical protein